MKNTLKIALTAVLFVAAFGLALTFCAPKSEKPVADTQDSAQIDTAQNPIDSTANESPNDSSAVK